MFQRENAGKFVGIPTSYSRFSVSLLFKAPGQQTHAESRLPPAYNWRCLRALDQFRVKKLQPKLLGLASYLRPEALARARKGYPYIEHSFHFIFQGFIERLCAKKDLKQTSNNGQGQQANQQDNRGIKCLAITTYRACLALRYQQVLLIRTGFPPMLRE